MKMARAMTGKHAIVVFRGGYHGRTFGTMAMTTSSRIYRQKFGPLIPGVHVTPFPYEYHGVTFDMAMAKAIAKALKHSILAVNLTWVLFCVTDAPRHRVQTIKLFSDYMPPGISEEHVVFVGTLIDYIVKQPVSLATEATSAKFKLHTNDSGFYMYYSPDG